MPILRRLDVPPFEGLDPFLPRINSADAATREGVARILARVAGEGDAAVRAYTLEFDGVDLPPARWELPRAAWQAARARLDPAGAAGRRLAVARGTS